MRSKQTLILLASILFAAALPGAARADELATKGRDLAAKFQRTVVTVQVVLKMPSSGGRSGEYKQELTGTVVNPDGLTVLALSAADPTELRRRMSSDYKTEAEVSDVKVLLDDGTEVPAEIVLRDRDQDLAFLRPKTKPAAPLAAVDLAKSGTARMLDEVIALNRMNKAASRAYSASIERISAVVQKPRTFYVPDNSMSTTSLGSPAFLPDGSLLGIFVMRAISSGGGSERLNYIGIILPAEEILKAAKQAPEVKPESEKKAEAKESAGEEAGAAAGK
jgi:hypothetical protein